MPSHKPDQWSRSARQDARRLAGEALLARAAYLPPADQALVRLIYERGGKLAEAAAMLGRSRQQVGRLLQRLVRRLGDPQSHFILQHLDQWDARTRAIALAIWLHRRSARNVADQLGLSLHAVRQQIQAIRIMMQLAGLQTRRKQAASAVIKGSAARRSSISAGISTAIADAASPNSTHIKEEEDGTASAPSLSPAIQRAG